MGYNGGPRGGRNTCARNTPGRCGCLHAETNALIKADPTEDKIAYLTMSPCELCSVALVNGRVKKVIYSMEYRDTTGLKILSEAGINSQLSHVAPLGASVPGFYGSGGH